MLVRSFLQITRYALLVYILLVSIRFIMSLFHAEHYPYFLANFGFDASPSN